MSIFAFFGDKGKYNLGKDSDLVGIADGTAFGSIKALAAMISGIENAATASRTYNAGEYILRNGGLYRVTTTIATGTVITVGVNIEETTIGGELAEIKSDLGDLTKSATSGQVSLNSYSTVTNKYTFPADGYLYGYVGGGGTAKYTLYTSNDQRITIQSSSVNESQFGWFFVRKGMKAYAEVTSTSQVNFIPLDT